MFKLLNSTVTKIKADFDERSTYLIKRIKELQNFCSASKTLS